MSALARCRRPGDSCHGRTGPTEPLVCRCGAHVAISPFTATTRESRFQGGVRVMSSELRIAHERTGAVPTAWGLMPRVHWPNGAVGLSLWRPCSDIIICTASLRLLWDLQYACLVVRVHEHCSCIHCTSYMSTLELWFNTQCWRLSMVNGIV